jgi:hypothetical protein
MEVLLLSLRSVNRFATMKYIHRNGATSGAIAFASVFEKYIFKYQFILIN